MNNVSTILQQANAYAKTGQLQQAVQLAQQALKADPKHPDILNLLGILIGQQNNPNKAITYFRRALKQAPEEPLFLYNLGNVLEKSQQSDEALCVYQQALTFNPNIAEAHNNIGNIQKEQGDLKKAEQSYLSSLALKPNLISALHNLSIALRKQERYDEALSYCTRAISLDPTAAPPHNNLGILRYKQNCNEAAISSFKKALSIDPTLSDALSNLGSIYQELGDKKQALSYHRQALKLDPQLCMSHLALADLKNHSQYDSEIQQMENLLASKKLDETQQAYLNFGLGKCYDDLHDYDKSFNFYQHGNSIVRKQRGHNKHDSETLFKDITNSYKPALFKQFVNSGHPDPTPIFIIGMPRSGTTLVEQIIASHPDVYGAGESGLLQSIVEKKFGSLDISKNTKKLTQENLRLIGEEYIHHLRKLSSSAKYITDKMPQNFMLVGMIKLALPNATIIHCLRDPVATCLSCFKQYFVASQSFSFDLNDLAHYYQLYQQLMLHWKMVLPGYINDFQYEDLINNQQQQSKLLLEMCSLTWDDACLKFHQSARPIKTASFAQVRKPIYTASIQNWKNYEKHLTPLLNIPSN